MAEIFKDRLMALVLGAMLILALMAASSSFIETAEANNAGCVQSCNAAFGNCYRASQDRASCNRQLAQCMNLCLK